jgi:hypothetical protein
MAYMGRSPTTHGSSDDKVFRKRMEKLDEKRLATQVRRCLLRPFDLLYADLLQRTWQSGEGLFGSFHASGLNLCNSTSFAQSETLETSLVKFINVFYQWGPGERKLVRFLDQTYNTSDAGPLVNVTIIATRIQAEEALRGEDTPGDADVSDIGRQVLTQAYRYHRPGTYRREKS